MQWLINYVKFSCFSIGKICCVIIDVITTVKESFDIYLINHTCVKGCFENILSFKIKMLKNVQHKIFFYNS